MKCQKCGSEVPVGAKFCNECGAKIEQVALFKDDETKSTESYECESCGNLIPNNSVFCPICHTYQKNKFSPTGEAEKTTEKKPIYRTPHFYIALLIALILCAVVVTAISQVNQPKPQETETTIQLTTEDSYYSYEEETTAYSEMAEYYMGTVGYQVPDSWKTKKSDGSHHYHYNIFDELFFVGCTKLESDKIKLDDTLIDELIKSDKETYDNYKEQSKEIIDMCGCKTLHRTFKCNEEGNHKFYNSYIFITDGYLYLMSFNSDGDKQSPNFDRYEKQIIDSIVIDSYDDFEDETESPTEKPTKKATEKPVDSITVSQSNALKSAKSYLEYSAFSYNGLVEQLEYEKYSHEDAIYAADHCGADWNEQAAKSAESYLAYSSFSRDGLIEQLEYEGFTHEQAVYGVEQNGL